MKKFKVDSYKVSQYENERFVDVVEMVADVNRKSMLCYSPKYRANVIIPKGELKKVGK